MVNKGYTYRTKYLLKLVNEYVSKVRTTVELKALLKEKFGYSYAYTANFIYPKLTKSGFEIFLDIDGIWKIKKSISKSLKNGLEKENGR